MRRPPLGAIERPHAHRLTMTTYTAPRGWTPLGLIRPYSRPTSNSRCLSSCWALPSLQEEVQKFCPPELWATQAPSLPPGCQTRIFPVTAASSKCTPDISCREAHRIATACTPSGNLYPYLSRWLCRRTTVHRHQSHTRGLRIKRASVPHAIVPSQAYRALHHRLHHLLRRRPSGRPSLLPIPSCPSQPCHLFRCPSHTLPRPLRASPYTRHQASTSCPSWPAWRHGPTPKFPWVPST